MPLRLKWPLGSRVTLSALRDAGIERNSQLEVAVRFGSDTAYHAMASLVDAGVEIDGVVACSDVFAMSAMRALLERGRKVPADVAIVGFDDIPFAAYTTPPLTTIRQNCHVGARLMVEKLMRAMRHESNESAVIPHRARRACLELARALSRAACHSHGQARYAAGRTRPQGQDRLIRRLMQSIARRARVVPEE